METTYKKVSDTEFEVTEIKEEVSVINLDTIETDIEHKDKLIANLQDGITALQAEKDALIATRDALKAIK